MKNNLLNLLLIAVTLLTSCSKQNDESLVLPPNVQKVVSLIKIDGDKTVVLKSSSDLSSIISSISKFSGDDFSKFNSWMTLL